MNQPLGRRARGAAGLLRPGGRARRARRPDEGGSVTVVVVAAIGVALVLLIGGLALGSAVVATHTAQAAADLGALAGAQAIQRGANPLAGCSEAGSVTSRNGARPTGCRVAPDGSVTVSATTSAGFGLPGRAAGTTTATARAGPSP